MNFRALFAFVPSFLLALAACSSDTGIDGQSEATQILRRGNGEEPGSLDPVLADDIHAFNVLADLYEGLVSEAADGSLIPGVAESWAVSDDGLVYTFTLRKSARWSNGDPVVAADFLRTFHRVASPMSNSGYAFLLEPVRNFPEALADKVRPNDIGVAAPTDYMLEISLSAPAAHLLSVLALPIAFPAHPSSADVEPSTISNGAFKLSERQIAGPIRLLRNEHYWDAKSVTLDAVIYLPIADPIAELNMYRAGELDVTNNIPTEHIKSARQDFGNELRIAPALALYYLAFDMTEPPFDNKTLRKALTMAIDRSELVSLIGRGEQPAYSVVPPGVAGYEGTAYDWNSLSKDDREQRAKELYRQAGYSTKNPLQFKFTYDVGNVHERVALAVTAMWREILGVEAALEKREWKYFLDTRDQRSEWDVMRFAWFGDYNAATTFLDIFESGNPQNLARYANRNYDEQLVEASSVSDVQHSAALLEAAETTLLEDYPVIPLYFFVNKHLVKPHVSGFENSVMDRHPSRYLQIIMSD